MAGGKLPLRKLLSFGAGAAALVILPVRAEENFFQSIETEDTQTATVVEKSWDAKAYVLQTVKYGWQSPAASDGFERNQPGFSQVKTTVFWEGQGDVNNHMSWQVSARGENEWYFWEQDDPRWKSHNSELQLRDAFIDIAFDDLWLRAGQQILAWGESEGLVITDVLSPQDLREPGQAELQDIREQVPALLASLTLSAHTRLSLVTTYSANSNRYADAQEPFDFFAPYRLSGVRVIEQRPTRDWEHAVKLERSFNGGDIALMAARVNDNSLTVAGVDLPAGVIVLGQQRQTVLGTTLGWVHGSWLLKSEVAHWQDVPLPSIGLEAWPRHDQSRAMLSLDYSGWDDVSLGLEINGVHTEAHDPQLAVDVNDLGYVARLRHSALNERIIQQARIFKLASEGAYIGRWDLSLDWSDEWTFTCSVITYKVRNDASLFRALRNHDSVNVTARYSF